MSRTLKFSPTDEVRAFVDQNSGDGTPFATPGDFMCDVIREKKARFDAAAIRHGVLEAFQDVIDGRVVRYEAI
jgi:hypothetical protein